MKKVFWIYLILTIGIMSGIFFFSAQSGEESSSISSSITKKVVDEQPSEKITRKEINKKFEKVEVGIRKTAHFLIYTALGFCVFMTLYYSDKMNKKWILFIISFVFCIIYASSDEIHQRFVAERSGEVRDVFIDSAGSLLGISIALFLRKIMDKRNKTC